MNPSYGLDIFGVSGQNNVNPNKLYSAGNQNVQVPAGFSNPQQITQQVSQKYNAPAPTPQPLAPKPQQQSNNNGSLIDKYRASGWNDINAIIADIAAGGGSKYQNSGGGENLDSVFNPLFQSISEQEGVAGSQYNDALGQIANEDVLGQKRLTEQKEQGEAGFTRDLDRSDKQKVQSLAEIVRYANALKQQGMARFGGLSSAGMAVNDITNQQTMRDIGTVQESYADQVSRINENANAFRKHITDSFDDWYRTVDQKKKEAKTALDSRLAELRSVRFQTESQRAQANINAIQQSQARVADLNKQVVAAQIQVALMNYQAEISQKAALNQVVQSYVPYKDITTPNQISMGGVPQATNYKSQKNPLLQQGEVYDEWGQLFDPYQSQTGA